MQSSSAERLRRQSHWLILALSAAIILISLALTLLRPSGRLALGDSTPRGGLESLLSAYQGPQQCAECHPNEFHDWSGTTHAQASFDPIFQDYLQAVEEPGECFACHTTGYNAVTGQFVMAGVTCEACHGPYRAEHPGQSMAMAKSDQLCGACHKSTVAEWRTSRHGQAGIACVACHEVHSQKTRTTVTTDALCAGCHQETTQDDVHQTHKQSEVRCVTCHLARPANNISGRIEGHAVTGHSFTASTTLCAECHDPQP
jgi:predicted CXXCH cytochrome family protein